MKRILLAGALAFGLISSASAQQFYGSGGNALMGTAPGANNIATGQVSVGATATQIAPVRQGRQSVTIYQTGTTQVYVGAKGVTTTTGAPLGTTAGNPITIPGGAPVYGIVTTGTDAVAYIEAY